MLTAAYRRIGDSDGSTDRVNRVTTPWTISSAAERVGLSPLRQGEVTFTVTNLGPVDGRAVCDAVPGEPAQRPWFTVADPQRLVPHGGSTTFLMGITAPADAAPGVYWVQGRVYSADSAPEETSVLSDRVTFELKPGVKPEPNIWLWLVPAAVLVLAALGVALFFLLRDDDPEPTMSPQPPTTTAIAMPDLSGNTEEQARATLASMGLVPGTVRRRHDPARARTVIDQSAAPGRIMARGAAVDLVVAVKLEAPSLVSPPENEVVPGPPTMVWNPVPDAASYQLDVELEICVRSFPASGCVPGDRFKEARTGASYTLDRSFNAPGVEIDRVRVRWSVIALDDFGTGAGPSGFSVFELRQ